MTFTLHTTDVGVLVTCDRCKDSWVSDFRSEADRWIKQHVCARGRRR